MGRLPDQATRFNFGPNSKDRLDPGRQWVGKERLVVSRGGRVGYDYIRECFCHSGAGELDLRRGALKSLSDDLGRIDGSSKQRLRYFRDLVLVIERWSTARHGCRCSDAGDVMTAECQ